MMGTIETTRKWLGWSPPSNGLCTIKETETDVKNDNNGLCRTGTVNSNTVHSKFHFIRSFCGMFCYHFPIISCLKCTVNLYFHLSRRKSLSTNDFELTVSNLCRIMWRCSYCTRTLMSMGIVTILSFSVLVSGLC